LVLFSGAAYPQDRPVTKSDPAVSQLLALGKPGLAITMARDEVLEILQRRNSCSAWLAQTDADPAATFASLEFSVDAQGPRYVIGMRSPSGEMLFKHPYSASTYENAGRHAIVRLNANGPFFVRMGRVLTQEVVGSFFQPDGWRTFQVDSYPGDTLAAQMTILLHELGHVVGRIPEDPDEWSGQSARNTTEVLRFCRAEINATERQFRRHGTARAISASPSVSAQTAP
jgi:hypothetical protein